MARQVMGAQHIDWAGTAGGQQKRCFYPNLNDSPALHVPCPSFTSPDAEAGGLDIARALVGNLRLRVLQMSSNRLVRAVTVV